MQCSSDSLVGEGCIILPPYLKECGKETFQKLEGEHYMEKIILMVTVEYSQSKTASTRQGKFNNLQEAQEQEEYECSL